MELEKAKEFIEKSISNYPEEVNEFYSLMLKHILKLEAEEQIEEFNIEFAKNMVRGLVHDFSEGSISFDRLQFFEGMSFLVYNWNDNVLKDQDITLYCMILNKFVECFVVVNKATETSKKALNCFYKYQSWFPPAHDVAIKYLEVLFKENEKCSGQVSSGPCA